MSDNDRILCQVLEQQLSLRLREACRGVLLHVLPAPLRGNGDVDDGLVPAGTDRFDFGDGNRPIPSDSAPSKK